MIIKLEKENIALNCTSSGGRWNVNICLMGSVEIDSFVTRDEAEKWVNFYNEQKEKGLWLCNFFPE